MSQFFSVNFSEKEIWPEKERGTGAPGGASDGLTQAVVENSIPPRVLRREEENSGWREWRRRKRERETLENKQCEIMALAVMHYSAAATLALFVWKPALFPPAGYNVWRPHLTRIRRLLWFDVYQVVSRSFPGMQRNDPSSLCYQLLIGDYRAPLIIQLAA